MFVKQFILLIIILVHQNDALKLAHLLVPRVIHIGQSFWINCTFDLQQDQLYSIKWYKNDVEFYRFLPSDDPTAQLYDLPGIYMDLNKSNLGNVYLIASNADTEGRYRCEVSAEAPSFQTVSKEKDLKVYYLPARGQDLIIDGIKALYHSNDPVHVICRTGLSRPMPQLTWYINDQLAPAKYFRPQESSKLSPNGLVNTSLTLNFIPNDSNFKNGVMKIKCHTLGQFQFERWTEKILTFNDSVFKSHEPSTFTLVNKRSKFSRLVNNDIEDSSNYAVDDDLLIEHLYSVYKLNDYLNVTCRSANIQINTPNLNLKWFINDKEATPDMIESYTLDKFGHQALGLSIKLNQEFIDRWIKSDKKARSELNLKCLLTINEILFETSKEKIIRRYIPTTNLKSASFSKSSSDSTNYGQTISSLITLWSFVNVIIKASF